MPESTFAVRLKADGADLVSSAFDQASKSAEKFLDALPTKIAFDTIDALKGAVGAFAEFASGINTEFEKMGVQADAVFGKDGGGAAALKWADDFAAKMPVAIEDVMQRMVALKAAGFDPLADEGDMLRKLSDATVALGVSFESISEPLRKISVDGKITERDIRAIALTGIPVFEVLSEKLGLAKKDMDDLNAAGVTGREVSLALADAIGNKYAGALEASSKTSAGLWNQIKETGEDAIKAITDSGPWEKYKDIITDVAGQIRNIVDSEDFQVFAKAAGQAIMEVMTGIGRMVEGAISGIRGIANTAVPLLQGVADYANLLSDPLGKYSEAETKKKLDDFVAQYQAHVRKVLDETEKIPEAIDGVLIGPLKIGLETIRGDLGVDGWLKEADESILSHTKEQEKMWKDLSNEIIKEEERKYKKKQDLLRKAADIEKSLQDQRFDQQIQAQKDHLKDVGKEQDKAFDNWKKQVDEQLDYNKRALKEQYDAENQALRRSYEQRKLFFDRETEDRQSSIDFNVQDIFDEAERMQNTWGTVVSRLTDAQREFLRANNLDLDDLETKEGKKKFDRAIDELKKEEKRKREDEKRRIDEEQEREEQMRRKDQERNVRAIEDQAKAMKEYIELQKELARKGIEHRIKVVEQSKFIRKFMADVFERAGVLIEAEQIKVAGV